MNAKLLCYDLSKLSQVSKVDVKRALFGFTEYSNNSNYTYQRKGILEEIDSIKPIRAVIIVRVGNEEPIIKVFKKYKVKYYVYNVDISKWKRGRK